MELNTVENVREFVNDITKEQISDEELIWFFCMWHADELLESFNTKDLAALLLKGQKPLNTLEQFQNKLDEEYEGYEENPDFPTAVMKYRLVRHFLSLEAAQEYEEQISNFE